MTANWLALLPIAGLAESSKMCQYLCFIHLWPASAHCFFSAINTTFSSSTNMKRCKHIQISFSSYASKLATNSMVKIVTLFFVTLCRMMKSRNRIINWKIRLNNTTNVVRPYLRTYQWSNVDQNYSSGEKNQFPRRNCHKRVLRRGYRPNKHQRHSQYGESNYLSCLKHRK